jgi:5-formyltetrahydrofolate cyclo-ligase
MDRNEKQRQRELMRRVLASRSRDQSPDLRTLVESPVWEASTCILLFSPLPEEPDPTPLERVPSAEGKRFLYPRISGDSLELLERTPSGRWITGPFGLREPDPATWNPAGPSSPDCAIVPGLAFDRNGYRLGRGRGYYDRLLGDPLFRGITIGVAWREQIVERVFREEHDIPVRLLLTPDGLFPAA